MTSRIEVLEADITTLDVDAIVNAANSALRVGGGVDGAIHRAAGPELRAECAKIGGCPPGEARITRGYRLKARHVIHTFPPDRAARIAVGTVARLLAETPEMERVLFACFGRSSREHHARACEELGIPLARP